MWPIFRLPLIPLIPLIAATGLVAGCQGGDDTPTPTPLCGNVYRPDLDGDGYPCTDEEAGTGYQGECGAPVVGCEAPQNYIHIVQDPEVWDCNDGDGRTFPGAREDGKEGLIDPAQPLDYGDERDNDCDGIIDEGCPPQPTPSVSPSDAPTVSP